MKGNLAIIPARSGSKGLKDKNIKLLNGKPLIAYSIEAAMNSNVFHEICISTDSMEYAETAVKYGGSVPFIRSKENSSDGSGTWDTVREVLENYRKIGKIFDTVTVLQPTSPLRQAKDISRAFHILKESNGNAVVSVCEVDHSPLWCNTLPEDHSLCDFIKKENSTLPRQKLDLFYRINGAIYMVKTDYFNQCKDIYDSGCIAYIMEKRVSVDIDDEYDFIVAEALLKAFT